MFCSDEASVLRDRTFIEQMKADILRRAEEANYSDEEEDGKDVAFEEELDYIDTGAAVKVGGDGEESGEEDEEGEGDGVRAGESNGKGKEREKANPETILEMAYIRDAKVFERDAATRRGKDRVALRAQTGTSLTSSFLYPPASPNMVRHRLGRFSNRGVAYHAGAQRKTTHLAFTLTCYVV